IIKEKSDLETENSKRKAENTKLKAESLACLELPVILEAQRSTRGTSSNSLLIKDLSDKKY
ncbi:1235_t:CDS:2, partial [Scutellospora calospora]